MDFIRILTRRNTSPNRGSGGRNRTRREEQNGGNRQFELILEMLARGLVEYAVRKYSPGLGGNDRERDGQSRHDGRLRVRGHRDEDQRPRGGVSNMEVEMLEHLGKTILTKAIEKFGGGSEEEEKEEGRTSGGGGRRRGRGGSLDRYTPSHELSREGAHGRREYGEERGRRGRDGYEDRSGGEYWRSGSPEDWRPHRDERHRRRKHHGTDYVPLKTELEALSNAIISLNERQPGHSDCEFYDAFVERSGKVQSAIGSVLVQIQEREERREERRGRRRN